MQETDYILRTERLYLRRVSQQDLTFLTALHQDPEVMRYIGPPRSAEKVSRRIDRIVSDYRTYPGYGIWMACQSADDEAIGWAALKDLDGSDQIEIGYRLARDCWGAGYATELARGLLQYGFDHMNLDYIAGVTAPGNKGSQRVLEKAGLQRDGWGQFYGEDLYYYKITAGEWKKMHDT